ncbi:MAG: type II CAAX endopeptidase family protein [Cyanobacteria bacterium P01_D01_bin.56]
MAFFWAPLALIVYAAGHLFSQVEAAGTVTLAVLYVCFIVNAWFWGRGVHGWPAPFGHYGLVFCNYFFKDTAIALILGVSLVAFLFGLEISLGWATLHTSSNLAAITLEGLAVGLGIGFAEEFLFRGWLLAELKTNLSRYSAIFWSGLIFAVAHFIKPIPEIVSTSPQFFGLLLLGLILGTGRYISRHQSRFVSLGLPIGLHAGLVWGYYIVDVADLITPSSTVPAWVTGIHGNPLSGALGVAILSVLAGFSWLKLRSK